MHWLQLFAALNEQKAGDDCSIFPEFNQLRFPKLSWKFLIWELINVSL